MEHRSNSGIAAENDKTSPGGLSVSLILAQGIMPVVYLALGFIGQFLFGIRFLLQWIASERRKTIVIPRAFWWVSIVGAITTGIYSLSILAYPIIMSQGLSVFFYSRSLYLSYNKVEADGPTTPSLTQPSGEKHFITTLMRLIGARSWKWPNQKG